MNNSRLIKTLCFLIGFGIYSFNFVYGEVDSYSMVPGESTYSQPTEPQGPTSAEIGAAENRANEAEQKAAAAVKEQQKLIKLKKEYEEKLNKKLDEYYKKYSDFDEENSDDKTKENKAKIEAAINDLQEQIKDNENKQKLAEETKTAAVEEMIQAYSDLAKIYEAANYTGDPVHVVDGTYHYQTKLFECSDLLGNFSINLSYNNKYDGGYFGKNWSSSLDSRIVRGMERDATDILDFLYESINESAELLSLLNSFILSFGTSNYPEEGEYKSFLESLKGKAEDLIPQYQAIQEKNAIIKAVNKYVNYGTFLNENNCIKSFKCIFYVDEADTIIPCFYEGNGIWKPVNLFKNILTIYSRGINGDAALSDEAEGGFIVNYTSGYKKYYSYYGLLEKEEDINHNIRNYIYDNETKKLKKIKLPNGFVIEFERNDLNKISKISLNGKEKTKLYYANNILDTIELSYGNETNFVYNNEKLLEKIFSNRKKMVFIEYEFSDFLHDYVVSGTTNINNNKETFNYDFEFGEVIHKTYSDKMEYFKFNENKLVTWKKDKYGLETEYFFNDKNQLIEVKKNGISTKYSYDSDGRPWLVQKENQDPNITYYNKDGSIESVYDNDGNSIEYEYDERGNVILIKSNSGSIKITRNEKGQVVSIEEQGIIYQYEYNSYGFVTKKSSFYPNGIWENLEFEYDSKNDFRIKRIKKGDGSEIKYKFSIYEKDIIKYVEIEEKDLRTTVYYDETGRILRIEKKDMQNNNIDNLEYIYDVDNSIKKIIKNGKDYYEFEYDIDGNITKYIVWDLKGKGIYTEFNYEEHGYESSRKIYEISENGLPENIVHYEKDYFFDSDKIIMDVRKGNSAPTTYEFDNSGKLQRTIYPNGNEESRTYSKTGRINSVKFKEGIIIKDSIDFLYKSNGEIQVSRNSAEKGFCNYIYDVFGRLSEFVDFEGITTKFSYDFMGNLISKTSSLRTEEYKYDSKNRFIEYCVKDNLGNICLKKQIDYDDNDKSMTVSCGDFVNQKFCFDAFGRIISCEDIYGLSRYHYDDFGNINEILFEDGTKEIKEYNAYGLLTNLKHRNDYEEKFYYSPDGIFLGRDFNGKEGSYFEFNNFNRVVRARDDLGRDFSFSYNEGGTLISRNSMESGTTIYDFDKDNLTLTETYSDNSKRFKQYNKKGLLESETNTLGKKKSYSYEKDGKIKTYTNYSGKTTQYFYEKETQEIILRYSDGSEKCLRYNPIGKPVLIRNGTAVYEYTYNTAGLLTNVSELTSDMNITYSYDKFGRIIRKTSSYFDFGYEYDRNNNIVKFEEKKSGIYIKIDYDNVGREIKRTFSNGIQILTSWNKAGQVESVIAKQNYGLVLSAEVNLYDEKGRLEITCNKNGEFTYYGYDEKGKLIFTEYNYDEDLIEVSKKEAIECGLYIKDDLPQGSISSITSSQFEKLCDLLTSLELNCSSNKNQYCWKEKYTYNLTGSVESIENPFGTIVYTYDSERRLISKISSNTLENGIKYVWSEDGNLLEINSQVNRTSFIYGENNRPSEIFYENLENGQNIHTTYTYDALNRRISETINGIYSRCFVYDGFSSNVLLTTPLYQNSELLIKYQNNAVNLNSPDNEQKATRYRTITLDEYGNSKDFKTTQNEMQIDSVDFEERPYVALFCHHGMAAKIYIDGTKTSGKSIEYFIPNYNKTQILSVSDENGTCTEMCHYGTWGYSVYENKAAQYSSSIGRLSTAELIYDLGNRDYIPSMKCFTTEDPAQDGDNWYSFCSCDCINYYDKGGYKKESFTPEEYAKFIASIADYLNFDENAYHENGEDHGIPGAFDCADLAHLIDMTGTEAAGKDPSGMIAERFKEHMDADEIWNAMQDTKARYFAEDVDMSGIFDCGNTQEEIDQHVTEFFEALWRDNSYRNIVTGYDRDYLTYVKEGDANWNQEENEFNNWLKEITLFELSNPDEIMPGTKLQWEKTPLSKSQKWEAHVATILARDFDADGNIIGFVIIEGHTGGDQTEISYMSILNKWEAYVDNINDWMGYFNGAFEIESEYAGTTCGM